jgi:hypothetical protein
VLLHKKKKIKISHHRLAAGKKMDHSLMLAWTKSVRPYLKNNDSKERAGDMAPVVELLLSKNEVLSSKQYC